MSGDPVSAGPRGDLPSVDRLLALCDGVVAIATMIYGRRKDLVTHETTRQARTARYRSAASIFVIAVSIGIAWVNTDAAKYCWVLLAFAPRIADRLSSRQSSG